ncbi:hypothetical protein ES703_118107 [subsurface metagenome]
MNGFLSFKIFSLYLSKLGGAKPASVASFFRFLMISAKSTPAGHQFVQFSQPVHRNNPSLIAASEGMRFTNAFCANPVCMPNRGSILTGLYPNMHGCRSNGINLPESVPTIIKALQKQGWHTSAIGKLHLNFLERSYKKGVYSAESIRAWIDPEKVQSMRERFLKPYYGFDEVEIVIGHGDRCVGHYLDWLEEKAPQYVESMKRRSENLFQALLYETELPEECYPTSYVTERSIAFLQRYANGNYGNKPFFLFCSYPDPHHPVCPPGKYKDMYNPENIELPSNFNNLENLKKHPFLAQFIINPPMKGIHLVQRETTRKEAQQLYFSPDPIFLRMLKFAQLRYLSMKLHHKFWK